jgi:hypothetical protein
LLVSGEDIISHNYSQQLWSRWYNVPQIFLDESAGDAAICAVEQLVLPLTYAHGGLGHEPGPELGLACTAVWWLLAVALCGPVPMLVASLDLWGLVMLDVPAVDNVNRCNKDFT